MTEHVGPVGALTTKDFRFKARVWFLKTASSVCQGCATGCNAHLDFDPRTNTAYRFRPRDNEAVNKYWMCDEGMLSYRAAHDGRVVAARVGRSETTIEAAVAEAKKRLGNVPKEAIAVVLSAQHSLEDNWAMRELGTMLGAGTLYAAGGGKGYADDILIDADKNSNTAGVNELAPTAKPYATLLDDMRSGRISQVIALGGVTPSREPEDATALGMLGTLVVVAAHEGALTDAAHVVLPATSWAEHAGTYVNRQGLRQSAARAIHPLGASKPAWEVIKALATALGLEPSWSTLKDVRSQLGIGAASPVAAGSPATTVTATGAST
jgi:NADH-quinone oxidoreductase subunit G